MRILFVPFVTKWIIEDGAKLHHLAHYVNFSLSERATNFMPICFNSASENPMFAKHLTNTSLGSEEVCEHLILSVLPAVGKIDLYSSPFCIKKNEFHYLQKHVPANPKQLLFFPMR